MIKNEQELAIAKEQVEKILTPNKSEQALLQKLQAEILEYEALVAHNPEEAILLEVDNVDQISDLPIKASIAFKINSQELAKICELEKSPVSDSTSEFLKVMKILGVQLIDDLFFVAKMSNELKEKLECLRMGENLQNIQGVA
ncbi:MAG: hypothetical protein IGS39_01195 [Calothrix sp. C42_A2020_038]|nr:hypothetical protein [Calothrix sp. C42_A2020_038]